MTSFIAAIKQRLPEADWPVVVSALRNNAQVWAELQDPEFGSLALNAADAQRILWSPGYLGLLRLGHAEQFDTLRETPMQSVSEKLRYDAAAAYEQLAAEPSAAHSTPDLTEATLLALALRERRRLLNGWEQLPNDVSIASPEFWQLPIACLLSLVPNQHELLQVLLDREQGETLHLLGLHALIANPMTLDVQSSHLLEIIQTYDLPQTMQLLRRLAQVNTALARQAAMQTLEGLDDEVQQAGELTEIQRLLLEAEVHQIGGQGEQAAPLLQAAWEASQQLQVDLAAKVAEANGQESDTLALVQMSADLADPKSIRKISTRRPAALLSAAKVALASDASEAKEMARAALQAASGEQRVEETIEKAKLLHELGELFVEMKLPQEAQMAAKAAVELQANDADSAAMLARLLIENGSMEEALVYAHLASALAPEKSDVRRLLAQVLQSNQQPQEALLEWKAVVKHADNPLAADWLALAETALASGKSDETIAACQCTLAGDPANASAHVLMGKALAAQGDEESAIEYLQRATQLAPAQLEGWLALAGLLRSQGHQEAALASLQTAQRHTTPSATLQALLAELLASQDHKEQAISAFQVAAQLAAEQADGEVAQSVAVRLSRLQTESGQSGAAIQTLQAAQQSFPGNADIARQLGRLLLAAGEVEPALASLNIALKTKPNDVELLLDVARSQLAIGLAAGAEETLQTTLAHKIAPPEARALMAEALAAQGRHPDAIQYFDQALKSDLGKHNAWRKRLLLGKAASQAGGGKPVAAIGTLETLDKHQPGDLEILRALCDAHQQAGHADQAALLAQKVYLGEPDREETLLWYAERMGALGKSVEACRALNKRAKGVNLNPRVALSLGKLQWEGESKQAALATFAGLLAGEDTDGLTQAGNFLLSHDAAAESIPYYQHAAELSPSDGSLWLNLAHGFSHSEQLEKALSSVDQSVKLAPNQPIALALKVDLLRRLGKPQAALQTLERALEMQPNDAGLLAAKADFLRENGDWAGAFAAGAAAFERQPNSIENLQTAAELAVLCLQPKEATQYLKQAGAQKFPSDLALLQAELQLSAGEEIAAAKAAAELANQIPDHPRLLALQSQLAAARGQNDEAASTLKAGLETKNGDPFVGLALAAAAERIHNWNAAIALYQSLSQNSPGLPAAQFGLGCAFTLRTEWQQLCEAGRASHDIPGPDAISKRARAAAKQAFDATQAVIRDFCGSCPCHRLGSARRIALWRRRRCGLPTPGLPLQRRRSSRLALCRPRYRPLQSLGSTAGASFGVPRSTNTAQHQRRSRCGF